MAGSKAKHLPSPARVSCSICLEVVESAGERSFAQLKCGHQFHLDCIGSAFNAKGAMQCPNCRHVEKGQWLYASGCFLQQSFSGNGTLEEDSDNLAGLQHNFAYLHDERQFGQTSIRSSQGSYRRFPVSNGETGHSINTYPNLTTNERQHQRALALVPNERMSWQNQAPVTPVFNPTWLSHEIGPWNVPSIEAERSLQSDVSLSGVYLQSSQPLFSRPPYGGSVLVGPSNTTDRQVYGHRMDGDVPSYPLTAGIRHATNRGTRDRVLAPLGSRPEVSSQMHLMQELRTHPPLNNIEQASGSHFQEMRWGAGDQPGPSRRMGAYSSFGSAGVSGHRWGHISMTSSSNFNQNGSTHVSATGYTGYVPGVNFLLRATDSQGHAQNHFETRNPWL